MFAGYIGLIRSIAVRGVGCTLLALAGIGSAHATTLNFRVEGLPSGLQVGVNSKFVVCANGTQGFRNAGSVQLVEDSTTTLERVTLPSGQQIFTSVVHYFYTGTVQVIPLNDNGCGTSIANGTFEYDYTVSGTSASGSQVLRTIGSIPQFLSGTAMNFKDTLRAQTTQIAKSGVVPTSLQMGVEHRVAVTFQDTAGATAIRNPTLEITRQVLFNGLLINLSVARAFVNPSNQVCVTSGSNTACRALGSGGTVSAGDLSVNISHTSNSNGDNTRTVEFAIKIDPSIGAGPIGLVGKADDFDSISYFVNGDATELDLLPWKLLRIPVDLVN